jgi:hypothetical protein
MSGGPTLRLEYKGNRRNLVGAYAQLKQYADCLRTLSLLFKVPQRVGHSMCREQSRATGY